MVEWGAFGIDYKTIIMNWILLIIAGFFEVGFATCLGKAKETSGMTSTLWMVGFFSGDRGERCSARQ